MFLWEAHFPAQRQLYHTEPSFSNLPHPSSPSFFSWWLFLMLQWQNFLPQNKKHTHICTHHFLFPFCHNGGKFSSPIKSLNFHLCCMFQLLFSQRHQLLWLLFTYLTIIYPFNYFLCPSSSYSLGSSPITSGIPIADPTFSYLSSSDIQSH